MVITFKKESIIKINMHIFFLITSFLLEVQGNVTGRSSFSLSLFALLKSISSFDSQQLTAIALLRFLYLWKCLLVGKEM